MTGRNGLLDKKLEAFICALGCRLITDFAIFIIRTVITCLENLR